MPLCAICSLFLCLGLVSEPEVSVSYCFSIKDPNSRLVEVRAEIEGLDPELDPLHLQMAERYSFVSLKEPLLKGEVKARNGAGEPIPIIRKEPYKWMVKTNGAKKVELIYTIPLNHCDLPIVTEQNDVYEQPFLDPKFGLLVAGALVIAPESARAKDFQVNFSLPEGWEVICPWKALSKNSFHPSSRQGLMNDLIAVGQWDTKSIQVGDMAITLAFAPGQKNLQKVAGALIEKIVRAEIALFQTAPSSKYLFLFTRPMLNGSGGSPKTGSMVLAVDSKYELLSRFYPIHKILGHLVAHEFFHLWGGLRYHCPDELRFFNEGFTDYYAYLILAREGILGKSDFLNKLSESMQACARNRMREKVSLSEAGGQIFFTDKGAYDLVYQGGMLVAALLDAHIRKTKPGSSLDDFMRDLNNDPKWVLGKTAPGLDDFLSLIESYLGSDLADHFADLVKNPYSLAPIEEFAKAGIEVKNVTRKEKPKLRGNLDKKTGVTLIDLDPKGLAYALGVRSKDRFLKINGNEPRSKHQVYEAWSNPRDGRIRVTLLRDGEIVEIDEPLMDKVIYSFPSGIKLFGL